LIVTKDLPAKVQEHCALATVLAFSRVIESRYAKARKEEIELSVGLFIVTVKEDHVQLRWQFIEDSYGIRVDEADARIGVGTACFVPTGEILFDCPEALGRAFETFRDAKGAALAAPCADLNDRFTSTCNGGEEISEL